MKDAMSIGMPKAKLLILVLSRFIPGLASIGLMLFLSAGTLEWWNGWLYLAILVMLMTSALIFFFIKDPQLLEKRMQLKEKEKPQRIFIAAAVPLYLLTFIIPGLDFRFGISRVPVWLIIIAATIVSLSYLMFMAVLAQNSFASRVVEIQEGQRVIQTGLYSVVRHPMYLSAILLYSATSLTLGSYPALIPTAFIAAILVMRIKNEEKILREGLPGYIEYTQKTRFRLVPFVW